MTSLLKVFVALVAFISLVMSVFFFFVFLKSQGDIVALILGIFFLASSFALVITAGTVK